MTLISGPGSIGGLGIDRRHNEASLSDALDQFATVRPVSMGVNRRSAAKSRRTACV
jgi:hypothetical protein